jgi:hypothetical protein
VHGAPEMTAGSKNVVLLVLNMALSASYLLVEGPTAELRMECVVVREKKRSLG